MSHCGAPWSGRRLGSPVPTRLGRASCSPRSGITSAILKALVMERDCDGFSTTVENPVGTNPFSHCGTNAWPPDTNNDTHVDIIGDISALANWAFQTVPPAPARYDIAPDPPDRAIDVIGDIARMAGLFATSCGSP